jgi:hypothetical protein
VFIDAIVAQDISADDHPQKQHLRMAACRAIQHRPGERFCWRRLGRHQGRISLSQDTFVIRATGFLPHRGSSTALGNVNLIVNKSPYNGRLNNGVGCLASLKIPDLRKLSLCN